MPNRATLSDTPSVYNDLITGYAVDANDFYNYFYHRQSFVVYSVIFGLVSLSIVLGLSTPLFVTIVDSIETTEGKGKPKLYYHFWSSVLLIIIGIWGYGILYNILNDIVYTVILISMLVNSIAGLLIALITAAREEKKAQLFSAPLSEYGCGNSRCTAIWSWIMTIIGFIFMLSFLVYVIYAIPTIAFVYYLYPTRTLIRVPFILGAVFYTITLMSLVLYLFEKVSIEALDLLSPRGIRNACRCCKLCCDLYCYSCKHCDVPSDEENDDDDGDDDESKDERVPLGESRSAINDYGLQPLHVVPPMTSWCALCKRFMCRRCIRQCASSVQHTAEQQRHNRNYYLIKVYEDLKVISGQCHFLISVLQLLAGMIILVVYICAELVLARLVFRQTNVTDINSLLALLPTVIFSVFTWFGRGLIFDVREDLKDLSIPYFKRKETIEEKMLQELIALRRSQCRHKRKVKRKVKRPSRRIERSASLHGLGETP